MGTTGKRGLRIERRAFLKLAAGAGVAAAGGVGLAPARPATGATTLAVWTGFRELVPFYKAVADASMCYHTAMLEAAGLAEPPSTAPELPAGDRKLVKLDASAKMPRSGLRLRLSGQGSGIGEKFRFVLEPAGGSLVVRAPSGKW